MNEHIIEIELLKLQRELLLAIDVLDLEHENIIQFPIKKGNKTIININAFELEELCGTVAFMANHEKDINLERQYNQLSAKEKEEYYGCELYANTHLVKEFEKEHNEKFYFGDKGMNPKFLKFCYDKGFKVEDFGLDYTILPFDDYDKWFIVHKNNCWCH